MFVETDGQGRQYIPEVVRKKYGENFHLVLDKDRIELIPFADDPLTAVRKVAGDFMMHVLRPFRRISKQKHRQTRGSGTSIGGSVL